MSLNACGRASRTSHSRLVRPEVCIPDKRPLISRQRRNQRWRLFVSLSLCPVHGRANAIQRGQRETMKGRTIKNLFAPSLFFAAITIAYAQDPLPFWNDTAPKTAIVAFVERVTKEGSPDFVKPEERIATFDNDGTLWVEQPNYTQVTFAIDEVIAKAPQHPEWRETEPFKSILAHDREAMERFSIQ